MRVVSLAAVLLTALLTSGCLADLGHGGGRHHGPPPHARAHGHRHHQGVSRVELSFDSGLGVYLVVDRPDHYFLDGHYLRVEGGHWLISTHLDGPWRTHAVHKLPPGLRAKHGKSHPAKRGRHGVHPGKRGKSKGKGRGH